MDEAGECPLSLWRDTSGGGRCNPPHAEFSPKLRFSSRNKIQHVPGRPLRSRPADATSHLCQTFLSAMKGRDPRGLKT